MEKKATTMKEIAQQIWNDAVASFPLSRAMEEEKIFLAQFDVIELGLAPNFFKNGEPLVNNSIPLTPEMENAISIREMAVKKIRQLEEAIYLQQDFLAAKADDAAKKEAIKEAMKSWRRRDLNVVGDTYSIEKYLRYARGAGGKMYPWHTFINNLRNADNSGEMIKNNFGVVLGCLEWLII